MRRARMVEAAEASARRGRRRAQEACGGNTTAGGANRQRGGAEIDKSKLLSSAKGPRHLPAFQKKDENNVLNMYEDDEYTPEEDTL